MEVYTFHRHMRWLRACRVFIAGTRACRYVSSVASLFLRLCPRLGQGMSYLHDARIVSALSIPTWNMA